MAHLPATLRYGPASFVLICSACLLALLGADFKAGVIVMLGDASYVMYLTHPYIEEFLDRVVGRFLPIFHIDKPIGCLIAMAFVLADERLSLPEGGQTDCDVFNADPLSA